MLTITIPCMPYAELYDEVRLYIYEQRYIHYLYEESTDTHIHTHTYHTITIYKAHYGAQAVVQHLFPSAWRASRPTRFQQHLLPTAFEQRSDLALSSASFVVANPRTGEVLSERNANRVMPIASITKLMTALVVLDANQRLSETLTVTMADGIASWARVYGWR